MTLPWRRLARVGFVVLALVIGKELVSGLPEDSVAARPFEMAGHLGEDVELRTGTVRVNDVRLASTVLTPTAGYRTPGLWVVMSVSLVPGAERETLAYTAFRSQDGARTWQSRSRQQETCPVTPPGVPVTCEVLIEVPPEQLPGGTLLVSTEDDHRYDSLAVIDLAIDADQVAAAEQVEEPLESVRATVGTLTQADHG
ncbi:hypothetical protein FNH13_07695 [Ornithinimicrobium ciconiae]|uniref:Uncharacterized protein n=1 Tax=Ornithinimicrobium ciconiae TaxID=2594265 RepID=A0A516G9P1_9MICO|nr:hypothetical protein [Ornithinimicrobium ciconiae]QDO88243.1 hypothetical protein FNH13_07695 [Ornithinimicrobium ciconiae]